MSEIKNIIAPILKNENMRIDASLEYFRGPQGISPIITITDIKGGHRVTITDSEGSKSFDVMDGLDSDDVYSPANPPPYPVTSVNNQAGAVLLTAEDVGARPNTWMPTAKDIGALPDTYEAPVTSINGKTGKVVLQDYNALFNWLINLISYAYNDVNQPPYPVTSVNGNGGDVEITAENIGALPDTYTPPVQSVNGKTGIVSISGAELTAKEIFDANSQQSQVITMSWLRNNGETPALNLPPDYSGNGGMLLQQGRGTTYSSQLFYGFGPGLWHRYKTAGDWLEWERFFSTNDFVGAGGHNCIYRGKNLGTSVSAEQYAAIAAGTFDDLYIGDYWVINNIYWRIAAFDYYLNTGDTACTTHHITLVPDSSLYNHVMNDTNITTGGYVGSKMYTTGLADAKATINTAFGSAHILTHRQYLCNAVSDGKPSGGSWYDSTVELMTEQNVYGGKVYGAGNDGSIAPALHTVDKSQFPLFTFQPYLISNRRWFWLRDVVSASSFACVAHDGRVSASVAPGVANVRPAFSIIG